MLHEAIPGVDDAVARPRDFAAGPDPLSRCVDLGFRQFADQIWGLLPLYTAGSSSGQFEDLFSAAAVDELVSRRGLRTPFLRMARNGSVLPETSFTRSGGSGATIADQVADDRVLGRLAEGSTLVLQALHRTWPPLVEFGSALAAQLGHPVQINSYVTPAQNQGFSAHYDTHDVFVLQIAGTKRWVIHEPVLLHPLPDQPWDSRKAAVAARAAEAPLIDQVLSPGDALYLPRGYLHAATALGELSIHLTVGVHPITGFRLIDPLLKALRDDPAIRRSLPLGVELSDPAVLAQHLRSVADRIVDAARRSDLGVADVAAALDRELTAATRPAPLAPLAQLAAAAGLDLTTAVRLRPGLRSSISVGGAGVSLQVLDKTITVPPVMQAAVRAVMSGRPLTPEQLPGLASDEQLVLVRRLLREGVVIPAEPTPDVGGRG